MSLKRFKQVERFLKSNNVRNETSGLRKGPDWWKKLELLAIDVQKASIEYYQPGSHFLIDKKLIKFDGRRCHAIKIGSRIIEKELVHQQKI